MDKKGLGVGLHFVGTVFPLFVAAYTRYKMSEQKPESESAPPYADENEKKEKKEKEKKKEKEEEKKRWIFLASQPFLSQEQDNLRKNFTVLLIFYTIAVLLSIPPAVLTDAAWMKTRKGRFLSLLPLVVAFSLGAGYFIYSKLPGGGIFLFSVFVVGSLMALVLCVVGWGIGNEDVTESGAYAGLVTGTVPLAIARLEKGPEGPAVVDAAHRLRDSALIVLGLSLLVLAGWPLLFTLAVVAAGIWFLAQENPVRILSMTAPFLSLVAGAGFIVVRENWEVLNDLDA